MSAAKDQLLEDEESLENCEVCGSACELWELTDIAGDDEVENYVCDNCCSDCGFIIDHVEDDPDEDDGEYDDEPEQEFSDDENDLEPANKENRYTRTKEEHPDFEGDEEDEDEGIFQIMGRKERNLDEGSKQGTKDSRRQAVIEHTCVYCGKDASCFKTALAKLNYASSLLCQVCQDKFKETGA